MQICTSLTHQVIADDRHGRILVLRDGAVVASRPAKVEWRGGLAVDFEAGRVYAGPPLTVYALDTLEILAEPGLPARKVAALGDGRIAALLGAHGQPHRLVIGRLGAPWERELDLELPEGQRCGGITGGRPKVRAIRYDACLSASPFGVAVSDGQTGVAARLAQDEREFDLVLHFGAEPETELFAEATGFGLLTVSRWAGREAQVARVLPPFPPIRDIEDGYGSFAHVISREHALIYDNDKAILLRLEDGEPLARVPVDGFITASGAGPDIAAFAGREGFTLVRREGETLVSQAIALAPPS